MRKVILMLVVIAGAVVANAKTARWISVDDENRDNQNTWIEIRQSFNLDDAGAALTVVNARIAADTKYWLWINDSLAVFEGGLKRGPNPRDTYYDEVDIAPYLKPGSNHVKVLVWYFGLSGFSHNSSGKSGFIFDAQAIDLVSDASWQSRRLSAYQSAIDPKPNYRLSESNIRYDARMADIDQYHNSMELGCWGDAPWNDLLLRPIPQWRDYGVKWGDVKATTANSQRIYSLQLPYNMQLTPVIRVTDPVGGRLLKIETDHVHGGSEDCIRAEYITCPGAQEYESLGWMNGDVLRVICPDSVDVSLDALGYRETGYDAEFEGSFSCDDAQINRFWSKAMRTLYVNMRDNYFDCPDRERAQWWGDATILMGQSFYQLSPRANALMSKAINELVDWQKADSALYSPIPSGTWTRELPAQMLASISTYGFWYYYLHTGDKALMEKVYPAMRRYLALWTLDDKGLTAYRNGDWSWGDWGTDVDMRLLLAAWHYLALQSAINVANLTGNTADIAGYEAIRHSIYHAFNTYWNGQAYRHTEYTDATDDRVQALAVVAGLADESKYDQIFRTFTTQEYASPYMEKYVMEALMKMGHGDYALSRFKRRFKSMIVDTTHSTLFEGWEEGGYGGGSTNHAWSGGMLTVIAENVCGVRPTSAGWKTFDITPCPVISQCDIDIPTVQGHVRSAFHDSSTTFTITVTIPSGTVCQLTLPHAKYASIIIDGKHIKQKTIASRTLLPGTHTISCKK